MTVAAPTSSWRHRPLAETIELASSLLQELGIVRVLDATRLDRLGVPVWVSVRPRARVLNVHAGKGLTEDEARVGAMMEAIEHAVAEPRVGRLPETRAWTPGSLQAHWAGRFTVADLAPPLNQLPGDADLWDCVPLESLGAGDGVWMPAELVFLPWDPAPGSKTYFGVTGNGLASGNSVAEASLHALFELLERDVTARHDMADGSRWVDPASLPAPFAGWVEAWAREGIELLLRELPNEFGMPCFAAVIHETNDNPVDLAGGWGLHARPNIALSRAICEAAQSRASMIHGGRDDIGGFFGKYRLPADDLVQRTRQQLIRLRSRERVVRYDDIVGPSWAGAPVTLESAWHETMSLLAALGFSHVYRHVFDEKLRGLAVVRLVVPGLEQVERPLRRMGPRMLRWVTGRD